MLAQLLTEPEIASLTQVDDAERIHVHMQVLARKRMIREVFDEFHRQMLECEHKYLTCNQSDALRIELGAGVYPIRHSDPHVLATDIVAAPHLDRVLDAQSMALADGSVRTLFAQNCFHHFPDPARFFSECLRVLAPGGGVVMIEPHDGPLAAFMYQRLFKQEYFDTRMEGWTQEVSGPMSHANQALSHIIFTRDRALYDAHFPGLPLVYHAPLANYVRYFISGGLNFRQLLPDAAIPALRMLESALRPGARMLALHHLFVLRKTP